MPHNRNRIVSRLEVEHLIANGHKIVIHNDRVLQLDTWIPKHPGGDMVVLHMVGRNATDEINAYHSAKTLSTMHRFQIGRVAGVWDNFTPPIQHGVFRSLVPEEEPLVPTILIEDDKSARSTSVFQREGTTILRAWLEDVEGLEDCSTASTSLSVPSPEDAGSSVYSESVMDDEVDGIQSSGSSAIEEDETPAITSKHPLHHTKQGYTSLTIQEELDRDIAEYPSLDRDTQQSVLVRYRELHDKVKELGLYDCPYVEYAKEASRYSLLFTCFVIALRYQWFFTSACFLGFFWQQIMFTAHDAGHMGITHIFAVDSAIGIFIADFCCGLSIGWWKRSHNVHHLVTNHPEHDPDIQNVPLFATSPSFFNSLKSSYYDFTFHWDAAADFLVRYQHLSYYPIMCVARFNLYILSWIHLASIKAPQLGLARWTRPAEAVGMLFYWFWFGYLVVASSIPTWPLRIMFVLVSHIVTMPLHVQITLSHWGMSTSDLGPMESFPQKQLRTTMDVDCPEWFDWFHGGLQFQVVHHLFPRVPRHNLRKVQSLVKVFCQDTKIEYKIHGFVEGNGVVLGRLKEVGQQVEMMLACQKWMVANGEVDMH